MSMPTSRFKSRIVSSDNDGRKDGQTSVRVSSSVELNVPTKRSRPIPRTPIPPSTQYIPVTLVEVPMIPKKKTSSKKGINIGRAIRNLAKKAWSPSGTSKEAMKSTNSKSEEQPPPQKVEMSGVMWKTTYTQPAAKAPPKAVTKKVSVPKPASRVTVKPISNISGVDRAVPTTVVRKKSSNETKSKITVNVNTTAHDHPHSSHHAVRPWSNSSKFSHSPHSSRHYLATQTPAHHTTRICPVPYHQHKPKTTAARAGNTKEPKKSSKAVVTVSS